MSRPRTFSSFMVQKNMPFSLRYFGSRASQCGILVFAILLTISSCGRTEESPTSPTDPAPQSLRLITSYAMSVTEPSGLAYSPVTKKLYMVSDNRPAIFTIDTTGAVIGTLAIDGQDLEGVTLSANADTFFVAEETLSQITSYLADGTKIASFPINVRTVVKHGPEGLTMDGSGHLLVINEKSPTMLLEYAGTAEVRRTTLSTTLDLSDICYDPATDAFWIVSDESQMVIKITRTGTVLGKWNTPVNQGEGIAIIGNRLYLCSDTDAKFYVFEKPS
jgi:uncharacterized protein YjiK